MDCTLAQENFHNTILFFIPLYLLLWTLYFSTPSAFKFTACRESRVQLTEAMVVLRIVSSIDRFLLLLALVDVMNSTDFSLGRVYMCNIILIIFWISKITFQWKTNQVIPRYLSTEWRFIQWIALSTFWTTGALFGKCFFFNAEAELHSSTYLINGVGWYNNSVNLQY